MFDSSFNTRRVGAAGEELAAQYLREKGFKIIERNWHLGKSGEIDLIAFDPLATLVFLEVKMDQTTQAGLAEEWVHLKKQRQIGKLALRYCAQRGWTERSMRFDVIAITKKQGQDTHIRHWENAFFPPRESWF